MTIPGIGPIISTAVVAAVGTGEAYDRGRDFAAWLGLCRANTALVDALFWAHHKTRQPVSAHAVCASRAGHHDATE